MRGDKRSSLNGSVIVSKNPCYLKGDIRVLKAVSSKDRPDLVHLEKDLVDCIVFPVKGHRHCCCHPEAFRKLNLLIETNIVYPCMFSILVFSKSYHPPVFGETRSLLSTRNRIFPKNWSSFSCSMDRQHRLLRHHFDDCASSKG